MQQIFVYIPCFVIIKVDSTNIPLYIYPPMNTVLQRNIKRQLQAKNLSVAELERRIGIRHAVVNILHGRSKNPSIHLTHAIAKELGLSLESMLAADDVTFSSTDASSSKANPDLACAHPNSKLHTQTTPTSKDIPTPTAQTHWDATLGSACMEAVNEYISFNQISPSINQVLECVNEIYHYTLGSSDKQIDLRFVQWICHRSFS